MCLYKNRGSIHCAFFTAFLLHQMRFSHLVLDKFLEQLIKPRKHSTWHLFSIHSTQKMSCLNGMPILQSMTKPKYFISYSMHALSYNLVFPTECGTGVVTPYLNSYLNIRICVTPKFHSKNCQESENQVKNFPEKEINKNFSVFSVIKKFWKILSLPAENT